MEKKIVSVLAIPTTPPKINHKNNLTILNNLTENLQNASLNASGEEEIEGEEYEAEEENGQDDGNVENGHYEFNNMEEKQTVDGIIEFDHARDNKSGTTDDDLIKRNDDITQNIPIRHQNSLLVEAIQSEEDRGQHSPIAPSTTIVGGGFYRKPPSTFQLSKQHTGMKNRSDGVGMAVTPTNKMEFVQENREEFGVLKINRPIGHKGALSPSAVTSPNNNHYTTNNNEENDDVASTVSSKEEGALTQQGYYDMKFFHNKLW